MQTRAHDSGSVTQPFFYDRRVYLVNVKGQGPNHLQTQAPSFKCSNQDTVYLLIQHQARAEIKIIGLCEHDTRCANVMNRVLHQSTLQNVQDGSTGLKIVPSSPTLNL